MTRQRNLGKKAELAQFAITQKLCLWMNPHLPYCLKDYANVGRSVIIRMKCLYLVIHIPRHWLIHIPDSYTFVFGDSYTRKPSMENFFLISGLSAFLPKNFYVFSTPSLHLRRTPNRQNPLSIYSDSYIYNFSFISAMTLWSTTTTRN